MHARNPGLTPRVCDNLSASRAKYPQHASHNVLQGDLCERVVYNDQNVLKDLRIGDVSEAFVKLCASGFDKALDEDIKKLKEIQMKADGLPVEELEEESLRRRCEAGSIVERTQAPKTSREREMYTPLQNIFDYIQDQQVLDASPKHPGPPRGFQSEGAPLQANLGQDVGFPRWTPAFNLVHDVTKTRRETGNQWRCRDAFAEVKPSSNQHPYPGSGNQRARPAAERGVVYDSGSAKPLITQVANYSRLHLSARAFAIQSVGLMIFGCDFCVSIFNHVYGRVSPCHNMWEDRDVFIRVVRSMTHILTDHELWQDKTVTELATPPEGIGISGRPQEHAYLIQSIGADDRKWCTVDGNIWSSLSLFGRGTTIWPVRAYRDGALGGQVMVMKTALRSDKRQPEFSIYQQIKRGLEEGERWPRGLAELVLGGDVSADGHTPFPTSFPTQLAADTPGASVPRAILSRIITAPIGKRIWDYTDELELLKGLLCALEAHKWLYAKGWLHRDISAGNILLSMHCPGNPKPEAPGFLIDLEYARASSNEPVITETGIPSLRIPGRRAAEGAACTDPAESTHTRSDGPPRGDLITGTLHFLSRRQLSVVINPDLKLEPTAEDDVESFFLVLVYAVIRSLACSDRMLHIKRAKGLDETTVRFRKQQLLEFFEQHWGEKTVDEIYRSRASGSFLTDLLNDSPTLAAGTVGTWFLGGGQFLVSDPLVNSILSKCSKKFDYTASMTRKRDRLGDILSPKSENKPRHSFLTAEQLFTYDELIELLKEAIAQFPAWTARLKRWEEAQNMEQAKKWNVAKEVKIYTDLSTV